MRRQSSARTPHRENRRDAQRAATRERVFLASLDEFLHVGFPAAQIDRIATAAGVSRGTFYFHFPTKEHVLVEIERRSSEATIERLEQLRSSRPGLREILTCLIDSIAANEQVIGQSELMRDVLAYHVRGPSDASDDRPRALVDALARVLADCEERDELHGDLSADQVALVVMTSLFGLLVNQSRAEGDATLSTDDLIAVLIRGLQR